MKCLHLLIYKNILFFAMFVLVSGCKDPLYEAIENSDVQKVEKVLKNGYNFNKENSYPLHEAVDTSYSYYVKNGKEYTSKIKDLGASLKIVDLLISYGANVNLKNDIGYTPLHQAAQCNNRDAAEIFIANGADVNAKSEERSNITPLQVAVRFRFTSTTELLIENGADCNAYTDDGETILHTAVDIYNIECIKLLIKNQVNINASPNNRGTPLHWAIDNFNWNMGESQKDYLDACTEVVKILMDNGADPNMEDYLGKSPLDYANENEKKEIIDLLIKIATVPRTKVGRSLPAI